MENEANSTWFRWWWAAVFIRVLVALGSLAFSFLIPYPYLWIFVVAAPLAQGFVVGHIVDKTSTPHSFGVGRAALISSLLLLLTLLALVGSAWPDFFLFSASLFWAALTYVGAITGALLAMHRRP